MSDKTHYEIHYLWQRSRQFVDDGFKTQENILRFRMFFTLDANSPNHNPGIFISKSIPSINHFKTATYRKLVESP